jgi:hypothetical protein
MISSSVCLLRLMVSGDALRAPQTIMALGSIPGEQTIVASACTTGAGIVSGNPASNFERMAGFVALLLVHRRCV